MQNSNRKVFDSLVSRTKIYLVIILILLIIISVENFRIFPMAILVYAIIVGYTYYANKKRKSEISETLQDLTLTVDTAAKTSLINSPFPLIILETDGNIIWRSTKFTTELKMMQQKVNELYDYYTNNKSITVNNVVYTGGKEQAEAEKARMTGRWTQAVQCSSTQHPECCLFLLRQQSLLSGIKRMQSEQKETQEGMSR